MYLQIFLLLYFWCPPPTALLLIIEMLTMVFVLLMLCSPQTQESTQRALKRRDIPQREE